MSATKRVISILAIPLALVWAIAAQAKEADRAQWVTLGTSGGPAVQAERAQIANALVVGTAVYLFDVGNAVQRQMAIAGIPEADLKAVFISHHHLDHNASLGPIIMTRWTFNPAPLPIFGPAGRVKLARGLAAANAPTEKARWSKLLMAWNSLRPPARRSFLASICLSMAV